MATEGVIDESVAAVVGTHCALRNRCSNGWNSMEQGTCGVGPLIDQTLVLGQNSAKHC